MKIIDPSWEILEELPLLQGIERAGRVAYQSQDKIGDGSAEKFVSSIIKRKHFPVLDMGVVHLKLTMRKQTYNEFLKLQEWAGGKYVFFDQIDYCQQSGDITCAFSGSPRALTEYLNKRSSTYILCQQISGYLYELDPVCFAALERKTATSFQKMHITTLDIDKYTEHAWYMKHKHVSVRFICTRAVSHELVRHRNCGFIQESQRYCRYADEVVFIRPGVFFKADSLAYAAWRESCSESEITYLGLLETHTPQAARTVLPNSCKTQIVMHVNLENWQHIGRLRTSKGAEPSMQELAIPLMKEMCNRFPMIDLETEAYS